MLSYGIFDVELSLAKGIIFIKIGLANGTILNFWAARPYLKFSRKPPVRSGTSSEPLVVSKRITRFAIIPLPDRDNFKVYHSNR